MPERVVYWIKEPRTGYTFTTYSGRLESVCRRLGCVSDWMVVEGE